VRLIIADDATLFREALAAALSARGHEVVAQAGDAATLLEGITAARPDVAIVDIRMPQADGRDGLDAALRIRTDHPGTGVLLLSHYVETADVAQILGDDPSGVGYLLKDRVADLAELDAAIRRIGSGGSVIDPAVVAALLGARRLRGPLTELTLREHEVLALMAEGRSNRAISDTLELTIKTVEGHIAMIFSKLGLEPTVDDHRRVLAVITFLRAT
jgi:DNA-binding NarL/FixJ family response regulator